MNFSLVRSKEKWNEFFYSELTLPTPDLLRIGYSFLLLINFLVLGLDLEMFFFESGLMPYEASRTLVEVDAWTLFSLLPKTDFSIHVGYCLIILHLTALLLGWKCRLNAIGAFIWMVSFQNRHNILFDGEDTVFRLLGFLLIFMPIGRRWALDKKKNINSLGEIWSVRLLQIQITLIYFSTAVMKIRGEDWQNGLALHYIKGLDDLFGRFPVPDFLLNANGLGMYMTWAVLIFELALPFALWKKNHRIYAITAGIIFHLSIDYAMNLFLFQWLMILGLISFIEKEEWSWLQKKVPFLKR